MSEEHHTKEQVEKAFAAAPEILRRLQDAGVEHPSVELMSDGSGKLVLGRKGDEITDEQAELAISLVRSQRPYDMFGNSDKIGITSCCGFVSFGEEFIKPKPDLEKSMLQQEVENLKSSATLMRSAHTNLLIDIQIALEEDDTDEAVLMIKEALGEVRS